jgi:hypothetical protein
VGPSEQAFVFDTTDAALWAEEVAEEHGIPVEVVPAPAASQAKCDLALVTPLARARELVEVLSAAGVTFRPWPPDRPAAQ